MLRDAIQNDRIIPYFQPIYEIGSDKIVKYEALVRIIKGNGEVVTPYHFLDIARKIRLYPRITEIMIEKSFAFFAENGENFSINLDYDDIRNEEMMAYLFERIRKYDIAKQLTIEILETQSLEDVTLIDAFVQKIYEVGAVIAIDDFGSGYANFEHITRHRSDWMKIDGSLIRKIDTDQDARNIVETIVVFAKKLQRKTVAEFVHSEVVYRTAMEIGIDYVQGYYLCEPQANLC